VLAGLPEGMEFAPHELTLLELAAHQADDLAALEAAIAEHGATVLGSTRQTVVNPAIAEARQARASIARIIKQLGIPDEAKQPVSKSERGRHAAQARWGARRSA
jgi:phage terminase small subunit